MSHRGSAPDEVRGPTLDGVRGPISPRHDMPGDPPGRACLSLTTVRDSTNVHPCCCHGPRCGGSYSVRRRRSCHRVAHQEFDVGPDPNPGEVQGADVSRSRGVCSRPFQCLWRSPCRSRSPPLSMTPWCSPGVRRRVPVAAPVCQRPPRPKMQHRLHPRPPRRSRPPTPAPPIVVILLRLDTCVPHAHELFGEMPQT